MAVMDIQVPNRILFGVDALNRIGELVRSVGERTVIVTEAAIQENPYMGHIQSALTKAGISSLVYDELQANAGNDTVQSILTMVKAGKPHSIIGFGGMKALSIARTVAALAHSKMSFEHFLSGEVPREAPMPFISIPSTGRDHFMAQTHFIMTDGYKQRPVVVQSQPGTVRYVVLDPKIATSLSVKFYSVVIMDVLLAAIEAYTSSAATFLSDTLALKAIENISLAYAEIAHNPRDIRPRIKASEAGMLSALALATSSHGIGAAVSFAANSRFSIPRSWAATAMLPFILELHATHQPNRVAAIARALGEETESIAPEDAAMKAARAVRRIISRLELPSRLRDFNLSLDIMPELAEVTAELEMSRRVPFTSNYPLILDLIKQAF